MFAGMNFPTLPCKTVAENTKSLDTQCYALAIRKVPLSIKTRVYIIEVIFLIHVSFFLGEITVHH